MGRPFLTVLIDTYNHERFIAQAITSVLEQDFPAADREILVVDDGSTDRTPEIIRNFAPAVRVLRKANGGQASAFNAGIPKARGEIVAFLDGDDWWAPRKLTRVAETFSGEPDVGMIGHGTIEVYPDGRTRTVAIHQIPRFRVNSVAGARAFRLRKSFLGTRSTIRTEILRKILPVPEAIRIEADEYVFTMSAIFGDVLILPDALLFYRMHGGNLFSIQGFQEKGLRLKQRCLALLAETLTRRFLDHGIPPEVAETVTEVLAAEASQLRLNLDGGFPWETLATEARIFRIMHERASRRQRWFKYASLIPALMLPPRWYYRGKRIVSRNPFYLRAREKWLPIPRPSQREVEGGAES